MRFGLFLLIGLLSFALDGHGQLIERVYGLKDGFPNNEFRDAYFSPDGQLYLGLPGYFMSFDGRGIGLTRQASGSSSRVWFTKRILETSEAFYYRSHSGLYCLDKATRNYDLVDIDFARVDSSFEENRQYVRDHALFNNDAYILVNGLRVGGEGGRTSVQGTELSMLFRHTVSGGEELILMRDTIRYVHLEVIDDRLVLFSGHGYYEVIDYEHNTVHKGQIPNIYRVAANGPVFSETTIELAGQVFLAVSDGRVLQVTREGLEITDWTLPPQTLHVCSKNEELFALTSRQLFSILDGDTALVHTFESATRNARIYEHQGLLWAVRDNGLFVFRNKELIYAKDGEFNPDQPVTESLDGTLLFPSTEGLVCLHVTPGEVTPLDGVVPGYFRVSRIIGDEERAFINFDWDGLYEVTDEGIKPHMVFAAAESNDLQSQVMREAVYTMHRYDNGYRLTTTTEAFYVETPDGFRKRIGHEQGLSSAFGFITPFEDHFWTIHSDSSLVRLDPVAAAQSDTWWDIKIPTGLPPGSVFVLEDPRLGPVILGRDELNNNSCQYTVSLADKTITKVGADVPGIFQGDLAYDDTLRILLANKWYNTSDDGLIPWEFGNNTLPIYWNIDELSADELVYNGNEEISFYKGSTLTRSMTAADGISSFYIKGVFYSADSTELYLLSSTNIDVLDISSGDPANYTCKNRIDLRRRYGIEDARWLKVFKGDLLILTDSKFVRIAKDQVTYRRMAPPIYLDGAAFLNGESWQLIDEEGLSYDQNSVRFNFHANAFEYPEAVEYQYRLLGQSEAWNTTVEQQVLINDLNPGAYTFEVKARVGDGQWSDPVGMSFELRPPFWQTLWFIGLLIVTGIALFFVVLKWRTSQLEKRKAELEQTVADRTKDIAEQKAIVEEKNKEIVDSITYAKRIQQAILPPQRLVKSFLRESFILYKPKDIVAGDFYWLEAVDDMVLFAAADCTGHGVPGAMVSVVCHNALNRAVREYGLRAPGEILDKTKEIVVQEFERSDNEVKDGMDIALCALDKNSGMLHFSGANNPLWLVQNGEMTTIKGNKQPIGKFVNAEAFDTHSFQLNTGDAIYIFSDGYIDQFGGEKGKKFKARPFRELLLSIQTKSMAEQRQIIEQTFEDWKGQLEQVDDVCVIGVKV